MQVVKGWPDDASYEDAMGKLYFPAKVERGLLQADSGWTIPHSRVKEGMAKWLK